MKVLLIALLLVVIVSTLGAASAIQGAALGAVLFALAVTVGLVLNTFCKELPAAAH